MKTIKFLQLVPFAVAALFLSACSTMQMPTDSSDIPAGTTDRNQAALDFQSPHTTHAAFVTQKEAA